MSAETSQLFEVQLQPEVRDTSVKSNRVLPPTIPTLPLRRAGPRRVAKTYYVGVIQSPRKAHSKNPRAPESSEQHMSQTCEEAAEIENRIAYRAERANRYASDRAFPVLTTSEILPEWQGQCETPEASLAKPTLVFLRRKKTVELDKVEKVDQKERKPWRPSAGRRAPEHPAYMSSAESPQTARTPKRAKSDRRKSLTVKELETLNKREAGRKRASELTERVLSNVRRNSTQSISLAEFHDKIRKAGEASRAKDHPELEESISDEGVDVLHDLPHLNFSRLPS